MPRTQPLFLLMCLTTVIGCSSSNPAVVARLQIEVEAERAAAAQIKAALAKETTRADIAEAELARLKASLPTPSAVDIDRQAAEWVLRVGGTVRVVADDVQQEFPKDGSLPAGPLKVTYIDLVRPSDEKKLTNEGMSRLKNLKHLKSLAVNMVGFDDVSFLDGIDNLETYMGMFADEGLPRLEKLPHVRELGIGGFWGNPKITNAGLAHLKNFKALQILHLSGCDITNDGLENLATLKGLRYLSLFRTRISDGGLEHLKRLDGLRELHLEGTQISGTGLGQLSQLPDLVSINLNSSKVSDAELAQVKALARLESLFLAQNKAITDAGLMHLKGNANLRNLNLHETSVTDAGVAALKQTLPFCTIFK